MPARTVVRNAAHHTANALSDLAAASSNADDQCLAELCGHNGIRGERLQPAALISIAEAVVTLAVSARVIHKHIDRRVA